MCKCNNVEMGSYNNQRTFPIPSHMVEYRKARKAAGLSNLISVDKCMVNDLVVLWANGIVTMGCCCGHNKVAGMINLQSKDDLLKAMDLGYTIHNNTYRKGGCLTVSPMFWSDLDVKLELLTYEL